MNIQTFTEEMLPLFYHYARLEGWDIEEPHIKALLLSRPQDLFVFYEQETLIGFIFALKESNSFGFISSFLVLQEFRGRGFGKEIFAFALEHLRGCQIALDSLKGRETFYEEYGFKSYSDVKTYSFVNGSVTTDKQTKEVVAFRQEEIEKLENSYMKTILLQEGVKSVAFEKGQEISSFGFMLAFRDGYKLSLEGEDINETVALFFALSE